ncbi:MAG: hypothetical protein ACFFDN_32110 [Candidatus Hodarchaeota archaeon]
MLELKELLEEREAQKQEKFLKLKEERLSYHRDSKLPKQEYELKRKNRNLLELAERAEYNPKYLQEYEQLLRRKECLRDYYRQSQFF